MKEPATPKLESAKSEAGFTIVELMVSVGVSALLIVGIAGAVQSTVKVADSQKSDAREQERRARALEILRQDWRGRLRIVKPITPPPAGTQVLKLVTSSDSLTVPSRRAVREVIYTVTDMKIYRKEGSSEVILLEGSYVLEFWEGAVWRREMAGSISAIRLAVDRDSGIVVVR